MTCSAATLAWVVSCNEPVLRVSIPVCMDGDNSSLLPVLLAVRVSLVLAGLVAAFLASNGLL
jgi:hypothetical protein